MPVLLQFSSTAFEIGYLYWHFGTPKKGLMFCQLTNSNIKECLKTLHFCFYQIAKVVSFQREKSIRHLNKNGRFDVEGIFLLFISLKKKVFTEKIIFSQRTKILSWDAKVDTHWYESYTFLPRKKLIISLIICAENMHTYSLKIKESGISAKYLLNMFWIMYFSKLEMISWFQWRLGIWMPANM